MKRPVLIALAALLCVPAGASAAHTVTFGSTLSQPPTDFDPPATCDVTPGQGEDFGACTRVAIGYAATGAVAGRAAAPVSGTVTRVRIRAGTPGVVRVVVARVEDNDPEGQIGKGLAVARSNKLTLRGKGANGAETFKVHLPVSKGDYLALEGSAFSAQRCVGGDVEQLLFYPLVPRRPLEEAFDRDGCTLLVQGVITRPRRKARAAAEQNVSAAPPNQYVNPDVTIDQGDTVTFTNNDTVQHDVTARQHDSDGKPLFNSALTSTGETKPVNGTEYLTTGDYDFVCSIHPNMVGKLHVTSNGTPKPRPSGGGGGGSTGGGGADTTKPKVSLRLLDTRLSAVRRRGALRVRVALDEAATVKLTARSGAKTLGTATAKLSGTKAISLKMTRAGRAFVRRRRTAAVTVTVRAADGAGNAATSSARKTLRR
jgi:plastocyanin